MKKRKNEKKGRGHSHAPRGGHGPSREHVLGALRAKAPRAMHASEVTQALAMPARRKNEVLEVLEELVARGQIREMPGQRFRVETDHGRASAARQRTARETGSNEVVGRLSRNPRGFGFVAADDGKGDVFIAPPNLGGA